MSRSAKESLLAREVRRFNATLLNEDRISESDGELASAASRRIDLEVMAWSLVE